MELQVQELLERIKTEGVDTAKKEAQAILDAAKTKADSIVASAEAKAAELDAATKLKIEAQENASRLALVQASRDSILALREKVELFMREAIKRSSDELFSSAFLEKILPDILAQMVRGTEKDLSVLLPEKSLKALDSALAARLSAELGKKVLFKPFAGVDAGFYISVEGSSLRYDFSADAVAEILASRVNARLGECVKAALEEGRDS
jgi:V/A-type H+-transporting ATPase subunit E